VTVRSRSELNNTLHCFLFVYCSQTPLMAVPIVTCWRIYSSPSSINWSAMEWWFQFHYSWTLYMDSCFASVSGVFFSSQLTRLAASFVPSYRILVSPSITMMDHWSQPSG
ncbi:unnamed protein product, partial [Arabidopsis halleri]